VEKATSELRSALSTTSDELTKQHAEELRALEERLVAKHQEELRKAVEAAASKAQESAPAPRAATTEDQKAATDAAVATAVAAKEAELKAKHEGAIEKAVESGRLEGATKLRLKDNQLIKAQNKVKELEGQIEQLKRTGVIPIESTDEPASATSPHPQQQLRLPLQCLLPQPPLHPGKAPLPVRLPLLRASLLL
jgi:nucleoprotein TPR